MSTSRIAQLAAAVAGVALLLFVGVPAGIQADAFTSAQSFRVFLFGGVGAALLALVLGLAGLWATRPATGRVGRGLAFGASLVGAGILAVVVAIAAPVADLPPINDITTDPEDPPPFVALTEVPANAGRDLGYPGPEFASQQALGYPDLAPIELTSPPAETHARALAAMEGFGWEIVASDPATGRIEATDTSRLFKFVDDIVVRIRRTPDGSLVDVRSKSREGRGDLGANAARIYRLRDVLLPQADAG